MWSNESIESPSGPLKDLLEATWIYCYSLRSGIKTDIYHSDMKIENYGRWIEQKIYTKPAHSVVVIDNAPYHNTAKNHASTTNAEAYTF